MQATLPNANNSYQEISKVCVLRLHEFANMGVIRCLLKVVGVVRGRGGGHLRKYDTDRGEYLTLGIACAKPHNLLAIYATPMFPKRTIPSVRRYLWQENKVILTLLLGRCQQGGIRKRSKTYISSGKRRFFLRKVLATMEVS